MDSLPKVRRFQADDLAQAAELLAQRHRRCRALFPILPARFELPAACEELLRSAMGYAEGFAAELEGRLIGFMFAVRNLPAPTSGAARYAPDRSSMLFAHGHAIAPDGDPYLAYHELFAAVARFYIRGGIFEHVAHVPAGDPALDRAWNDLGFGRSAAVAARTTEPTGRARGASVWRAGPDDLERVARLVDEESRFHARPPMFRPYLSGDTRKTVLEELRSALGDPGQAILLGGARRDQPVGVLCIGPARGSPLFIPDDAAYIGDTAVLDGHRGAGVGSDLLEGALGWAREQGYRHLTLHFATSNAVSSAFWVGHGFVPVMYHLRRTIDQRIAWAIPADPDA
jgi:GNAT superfamily N-acetyltransferase